MSLERESTRIVIAGASSLLGAESKTLLEQGRFAIADFRLLDEELAAGTLTEAGGEPVVIRTESVGFEAFRGRNAFLEQDFSNMRAVNSGMKSRGWAGAFTNPSQERQIVYFHRMLNDFLGR